MRNYLIFVAAVISTVCASSQASVTEYFNRTSWGNAVGPYTTITFQGYPKGTLISTQYAHLGVVFPDGNDTIEYNDSFVNDEWGLNSNSLVHGIITLDFNEPMSAVACDFLGLIDIWLYAEGELIWESAVFSDDASRFGGLVSTVPFDVALIRDPTDGSVNIDDLYFGGAVPGPSALALFAFGTFPWRGRVRR
jgi:hypothetical protein